MRLRVKDVVLLSGHKEEKSEQNHPPPPSSLGTPAYVGCSIHCGRERQDSPAVSPP